MDRGPGSLGQRPMPFLDRAIFRCGPKKRDSFMNKLVRGVLYRLRSRMPKVSALLSGELPLRSSPILSRFVEPANALIPNVVYQTWKLPRFGRRHLRELEAFRRRNPDFSFHFFTDEEVERYMASAYRGTPILDIFNAGRFGPLRTDIWRYCILYERGGIYCDIGKAIAAPLREIISPNASAVVAYERNRVAFEISEAARSRLQHPDLVVVNWALMFAPRHPFLRRVIDGIVAKYPNYRGRVVAAPKEAIIGFTGPVHLTECLHQYAARHELGQIQQAGVDFEGQGMIDLPGSYVRYVDQKAYAWTRDQVIVD
jgi:mannosyltransferase OCH1-like enzyme